jgi:hypothetical protein
MRRQPLSNSVDTLIEGVPRVDNQPRFADEIADLRLGLNEVGFQPIPTRLVMLRQAELHALFDAPPPDRLVRAAGFDDV